MIKKDISKILTKGSAKKRAILFFSNLAQAVLHKKEFLTEAEKQNLYDSFKTNREIKIYNQYRKTDQTIRYAIGVLVQYQFIYQEKLTRLGGFINQWDSQKKVEELINLIIDKLDPKKEKQKELKKIIELNEWFYPASTTFDKEGFLHLDIDTPPFEVRLGQLSSAIEDIKYDIETKKETFPSFQTTLDRSVQKAKKSLIECKTIVEALYNFLEEKEFKIEIYCLAIENIIEQLKKIPYLYNPMFSKTLMEEYRNDIASPPSMMEQYLVLPQYEELEIDKAFYENIQTTILG